MVKMIRQKREWVCSHCGAKAIKWSGFCPGCKAVGTMKEHIIIPVIRKPRENVTQKSIRRRAIGSERESVRGMQDADGPDPFYKNITSSTGRVGHITNMQVDGITRSYVIENKNRSLPIWINKAWIQILQKAADFNKHALLHIEPSNIIREYPVNGVKKKTDTMAIIAQSRHLSLIRSEKTLQEIEEIVRSSDSNVVKVRKITDLVGS